MNTVNDVLGLSIASVNTALLLIIFYFVALALVARFRVLLTVVFTSLFVLNFALSVQAVGTLTQHLTSVVAQESEFTHNGARIGLNHLPTNNVE